MKLRTSRTPDGKALRVTMLSDRGVVLGIYTLRAGRWRHAIPGTAFDREISDFAVPASVREAGEGWTKARENETAA